jgi:hypothetical protein
MQNVRRNNLILYHFIVFLYGFTSVTGALISLAALPLVVYRMLIAAAGLALFFLFFPPVLFSLGKTAMG